jgi:hypothetical protein
MDAAGVAAFADERHHYFLGLSWQTLLENADAKILASEPTNQFTGTLIGVYAARTVER